MKRAVVTRADRTVQGQIDLSHGLIRRFCTQWGADFVVLGEEWNRPEISGNGRTHYRILDLYENVGDYDRIMLLDSDLLIMPNCPNLFDFVPEECIGTVLEDKGSRQANRRSRMQEIQRDYGDIGWREGWVNTGVFMTSSCHRDIFRKFKDRVWDSNDDPHIGYLIHMHNYPIFELPFQWNHMSMYSEPWNGAQDRFDSYIIHYAGQARFPGTRGGNKVALMREDYARVYGGQP